MRSGHHLREVDHRYVIVVIEHQVELVEISMNKSMIGQFDDQLHDFAVQQGRVLNFAHLTPGTKKRTVI